MTDLLDRLFDRQVCSPAQNSCRNDYRMDEAAAAIAALRAEVERLTAERDRLRAALQFYACRCVNNSGCAGGDLPDCGWTARAALEPPR